MIKLIFRLALPGVVFLLMATVVQAGEKAQGLRLIMFERDGCHYCEVWNRNVGVSYDKTDEGRFAPLERRDLGDGVGEGVKPVVFTPTFVLVKNGREVGRLTGYISEDFFWGLLQPLLEKEGYKPGAQNSGG